MRTKLVYFAALAAVAVIAIVLGLSLGLISNGSSKDTNTANGSKESTTATQAEDTAAVSPTESPVTSNQTKIPTTVPREISSTEGGLDFTPFSDAIAKFKTATVARIRSSLLGSTVDIVLNQKGDGVGTIEIAGETRKLLAVDTRAFLFDSNSTRWAYLPDVYQVINSTMSLSMLTTLFRYVMEDEYVLSNDTVGRVPALKASTVFGHLYVSSDFPHQVLRVVTQTPSPSFTLPPLGRRLLAVQNGAVDITDMSSDVDAPAEIDETIADVVPDLKNAFDLSAQFKTSGQIVLAHSSSSCTVTASVSSSFVSENVVATQVSADLTATMTVDGQAAGGCSATGMLSVNGISTISCINNSPAYVSAYARATRPRSRAPRLFPILASALVFSRAYTAPDVNKLITKYNTIATAIQKSRADTSRVYRISRGNKIWRYGITSRTGNPCGGCKFKFEGTYSTRSQAYSKKKELLKTYRSRNKQSLPPGQITPPYQQKGTPVCINVNRGRKLSQDNRCDDQVVGVNSGKRETTPERLEHTVDRGGHARDWYGIPDLQFRTKKYQSFVKDWTMLIDRVTAYGKQINWSTGQARTVGHVAIMRSSNGEARYFMVQYYRGGPEKSQASGLLATAFEPNKERAVPGIIEKAGGEEFIPILDYDIPR